MNLELRKITLVKALSQETPCFHADIFENGVKVGTVENHGTGGMHSIFPVALSTRMENYAATLPHRQVQGFSELYPVTAETLVDDLLYDYQLEKELRSKLRQRVLWIQDGKLYQTPRRIDPDQMRTVISTVVRRYHATAVLNLLPMAEAVRVFRKAIAEETADGGGAIIKDGGR